MNIEFLINLVIKQSLILLVAFAATQFLKKSSASIRHCIWTMAFAAVIALIPLSLVVPKKPVSLLPPLSKSVEQRAAESLYPEAVIGRESLRDRPASPPLLDPDSYIKNPIGDTNLNASVQSNYPLPTDNQGVKPKTVMGGTESPPRDGPFPWSFVLLLIWGSGMVFSLLRFSLSLMKVREVAKKGSEVSDESLKHLLQTCIKSTGLQKRLRMLMTHEIPVPATCGLFRPILLMPEDSIHWPPDKLQAVILHELAHVKRQDYLTNLIAQAACTLYWFNPLMWIAVHLFWREREMACDDYVLGNGTGDCEYADHLLEIAKGLPRLGHIRRSAAVLAHKSDLKGRLRHILTKKIDRRSLTPRSLIVALTIVALITVPLAMATIQERQAIESSRQSIPRTYGRMIKDLKDRDPEVQKRAAWALGDREDKEAVPALITTLKDKNPEVRAMAAWALGEIKDERAIEPLIEALDDRDDYAREMIIRGLAEHQEEETVSSIAAFMEDENPYVRIAVVWAMGEIGGTEAFTVAVEASRDKSPKVREWSMHVLAEFDTERGLSTLLDRLKDREANVRTAAASSLGRLGLRSGVTGLIQALTDSESQVRLDAALALGQIGDSRALDPLIRLLRDKDPDVRSMAVWALDEISQD